VTLIEALGYAGAIFVLVTHSMKTMIPLRIMGIGTNCIMLAYGVLGSIYPTILLHAVLLPLNAIRLYQMVQLVRKVRLASQGNLSLDWLKPFMSKRHARAGETLFRKGEAAEYLFFPVSGRFRLKEIGVELQPGQAVGELGFVAPDSRRTQTVECVEAGDILTISYDKIRQIYFQNPEFGFYFLNLTTSRLFQDVSRLENELSRLRGSGAPAFGNPASQIAHASS
jgi:CRP/FNR family transcriptional regulator, cyclic AMP receptor protein